jgi:disulfide bond formation protein DsbB
MFSSCFTVPISAMREKVNKLHSQTLLHLEKFINAFAVLSILLLSSSVIISQIVFHQLPCPLCLLLRVGYLALAFGFLLNLRFGIYPSHYSVVLLCALFTSFISLRQMAIIKDSNQLAFNATFLGIHWMTWSFGISIIIVASVSILLGFDRKYEKVSYYSYWKSITHSLFIMLALLILMNTVAAFLQCDFSPCPDVPVGYELLD